VLVPHVPGLTILRQLGRGGFGTVFLARQDHLGREVAVKFDNRGLPTDRDRARFLREARAAARLSGHPNVVNVYDAGVTPEGQPYIVMELCPAGSLSDLLEREGPLPPWRVAELGAQLADALAHAHGAGILHRDIKPANILVNAFGAVKLADFGLAAILDAHAESTVTMGALSPNYAAPEVFAQTVPSPAGDVYSLAATLYTLACGRRPRQIPWPAESLVQLVGALQAPVPAIGEIPPELDGALRRALAADVAHRTPTAAELRDELRGAPARRPTPSATPPPPRSTRVLRAAAVAAAAVLVAAAGFLVRGVVDPGEVTAAGPTTSSSAGSQAGSGTSGADVPTTLPDGTAECEGHEQRGLCVTDKCFGGLVNNANQEVTARALPCTEEHSWQAFSAARLPSGADGLEISEVEALPEVTSVCNADVMAARTLPGADTTGWEISTLPAPDNDRYTYCVATPTETDSSQSVFTSP
jgi:eukaryotic-like serine/threonine-protein kinase